jgi:hypothetical protein
MKRLSVIFRQRIAKRFPVLAGAAPSLPNKSFIYQNNGFLT